MMAEHGDWKSGEPYEPSFSKFLADLFPDFDEKDRFADICRGFEANKLEGLKITLKEVTIIKLFSDAYFLAKIRPKTLTALQARMDAEEAAPNQTSDPDA